MKFPNAASGVKKIYIAQILALFATLCTGAALVYASIKGKGETVEQAVDDLSGSGLAIVATAALIGAILLLVAWIVQLVGVIQASRDEDAFKAVLYLIIFAIIVSIVSAVFSNNETVSNIANIASDVLNLITTLMIIAGIVDMAAQLGNTDVPNKGKAIVRIICATLALTIIIKIVMSIFKNDVGTIVAGVLAVIALVLEVVQFIVYLVFLSRASKILNS